MYGIFQKVTSVLLVVFMMVGVFGLSAAVGQNGLYAAEKQAVPEKNIVKIPAKMKYGNTYVIEAKGDRFQTVYSNYQKYINLKAQNTATNFEEILTDDVSMFTEGESFYVPTKMTLTKTQHYPSVIKFYHKRSSLKTNVFQLKQKLSAGKYTLLTEFTKSAVSIIANDYSTQEVYFMYSDKDKKVVKRTFYVASKVKLAYGSKKGKLAKSKRTKYLNPTQRFGKLPTPKAKRGYKFVGWYSKKSGGIKIKKNTKVPTKNTQTIYARYVKV